MALNPKQIQFFVDRISNGTINTLKGTVSQLFEHLTENVKDNPVYDAYQGQETAWRGWPDQTNYMENDWEMPPRFDDAKTLAYHLYKRLCNPSYGVENIAVMMNDGKIQQGLDAFNNSFLGYFAKALDDIIIANPEQDTGEPDKVKGTKVFIIHGHDDLLKKDLQLLLLRAGVNNIVLHEQADKGRSIIDKVIEEGKDSIYAIGLLTPDDLLDSGTFRARQNVIFELGYFLGYLGKERVRMLIKGDLEVPSDLHGILYEKHDAAGAWKMKLLKELMAVGIYVDLNSVVSLA